jgi:hypothetical protein
MQTRKEKDMTYELECKGCYIYIVDFCPFSSRPEKVIRCPCRTCLIKVVCNKACEEYEIFVKDVKEWGGKPPPF